MNSSIITTEIKGLNTILKNHSSDMTIEETLMVHDAISKMEELLQSFISRKS